MPTLPNLPDRDDLDALIELLVDYPAGIALIPNAAVDPPAISRIEHGLAALSGEAVFTVLSDVRHTTPWRDPGRSLPLLRAIRAADPAFLLVDVDALSSSTLEQLFDGDLLCNVLVLICDPEVIRGRLVGREAFVDWVAEPGEWGIFRLEVGR